MSDIIYVDEQSSIPLYGLDFLGIIDRGTNIIEIKPITLCNLQCRYCFVNSGNYSTNFIVDKGYLIEKVKTLVALKGPQNLELHFAPYGEVFLYHALFFLLNDFRTIKGVETISLQTNGLLLTPKVIQNLEKLGVTRVNLSLNTFDKKFAEYLTDCKHYDLKGLLQNINALLEANIDVLLAPVWFPGENKADIEDIILFVARLREKGYSEENIQLGIQKYLIYKTGRKLKKIRPKTWGYFYQQLSELENEYDIKLKLGPEDFGIHERPLLSPDIDEGDIIPVTVVSKGRWDNECIGRINEDFGCKILLNYPIRFSEAFLGKNIEVKVLKSKRTENLITAFFPIT